MKTNKLAIISFCLGIASYFFWELSIIPSLTIILGVIAVVIILKNKEKGLWYGIIGIALGILGLLFRIYLGGVHAPLVSKPVPETQTAPYKEVGLEKLPQVQTPATVTSLSEKESIKETCSSSPEDNILNLVTIDESSLLGNSNEYIAITGRYPVQTREKTPTSIMIWKGKYDLSSVNPVPIDGEIAYRDQTDHGGLYFWVCPSGRFLADLSMNKVLLNEGIYTIGIYHYDQGDMKSILLTSGILRVAK